MSQNFLKYLKYFEIAFINDKQDIFEHHRSESFTKYFVMFFLNTNEVGLSKVYLVGVVEYSVEHMQKA